MTYVKTYLPKLKTHVVNLKRDAKDLSRDLQGLEVRVKLRSKTLYYCQIHCITLCILQTSKKQNKKTKSLRRLQNVSLNTMNLAVTNKDKLFLFCHLLSQASG